AESFPVISVMSEKSNELEDCLINEEAESFPVISVMSEKSNEGISGIGYLDIKKGLFSKYDKNVKSYVNV
ncbi:15019_t:CDS:2, partial [Gigaspora margarita]